MGHTSELSFELFESSSHGFVLANQRQENNGTPAAAGASSSSSPSAATASTASSSKPLPGITPLRKLHLTLGPARAVLLPRIDVDNRSHDGYHMRVVITHDAKQRNFHLRHIIAALNRCSLHAIQLHQWVAVGGGMAAISAALAQLLDELDLPSLRRLSLPIHSVKTDIRPPLGSLIHYLNSNRSFGLTHLRVSIPYHATPDPEVAELIRAAELHPTLVHMCFGWCSASKRGASSNPSDRSGAPPPSGPRSGGYGAAANKNAHCDFACRRACRGIAGLSEKLEARARNAERVKAAVANALVPSRVILRGLYSTPAPVEQQRVAPSAAQTVREVVSSPLSAVRTTTSQGTTNLASRFKSMLLPVSSSHRSVFHRRTSSHSDHSASSSCSSDTTTTTTTAASDSPPHSPKLGTLPALSAAPRPPPSPLAQLPVELVLLILQHTSGDINALTAQQWNRLFAHAQEPSELVSLARAAKGASVPDHGASSSSSSGKKSSSRSDLLWVPGRDAGFKLDQQHPKQKVATLVSMADVMDEWMDAAGFRWDK